MLDPTTTTSGRPARRSQPVRSITDLKGRRNSPAAVRRRDRFEVHLIAPPYWDAIAAAASTVVGQGKYLR
jgi:hypothetical protein